MNKIAQDIIKEFGLDGLPPAEQKALVEQFSDVVMQAVLVRALATLTEKQKDALDAALANDPKNPDIMLDFLMTALPDFENIVQEEVARIREKANVAAPK